MNEWAKADFFCFSFLPSFFFFFAWGHDADLGEKKEESDLPKANLTKIRPRMYKDTADRMSDLKGVFPKKLRNLAEKLSRGGI